MSIIARLTTLFLDGHLERYDGTLGNNNFTAGTGTPKTRGTWSNTVYYSDLFDLTGTVNYYSGYDLSAMDQGTDYKDCGLSNHTTPAKSTLTSRSISAARLTSVKTPRCT